MRYSTSKEINLLVKEMVRAGWRYESGKHGKLYHPTGSGLITFSRTPSDYRAILNLCRDIRKITKSTVLSGS